MGGGTTDPTPPDKNKKTNKEPRHAPARFMGARKSPENKKEEVGVLPTADPATVFERPVLFGTVRRGAREGETEIRILRSKVYSP